LSVVHVPEESIAVIGRPGFPGARTVGPGIHLRIPILESFVLFPESGEHSGSLAELRAAYRGPRHPVLVVGIDAADWSVIEPLIARGEMPAISALRRRGAWGTLKSMLPMLSPLLWTTVATGKTPDQHGIVDFLVEDPATGEQVPITSRSRRARAIWSILTDLGLPSLTVGWWATWPAEKVDGAMVSDRVSYSLFESEGGGSLQDAIQPGELAAALEPLVRKPREISLSEVRRIIDIGRGDYARAIESLDEASSWEDPVAHLLRILAATKTYHEIAVRQMKAGQPPLSLVYYEGLDEVNHRFAHYAAPAMRWADPEKVPAFENAVENFYRLQDRLVGELVEAADPGTVILLISDHGFGWGDRRPTDVPPDIEGKPGRWHTRDGVIVAAGPPVRPGRLERDPGLLDIAPTILALLSLPLAEDMPGRVISSIAPPGALPDPPRPSIATYEAGSGPREDPGPIPSSPVDAEMLAKLRALGYVGGGEIVSGGTEGGGTGAANPGTATGHVNMANVLLARGDARGAEPEYRAALALAPQFVPARLGLAQCLIATGRETEGWKEIRATLMDGRDLDAGIYLKVAGFYREHRLFEEGASVFEELPRREGLEAARLAATGSLLLAGGDEEAAGRRLRAALHEDPAFSEALQELYVLLTRRGDLDDLISVLEESVRSRPGGLVAANLLALTYERAGRAEDAIRILDQIVGESPRDVATLTNLAGFLLRQGRESEALPLLERAREIDPANLEGLVNLVVAQGKLKDLAGARETFQAAGGERGRVEILNAMAYAYYLNGKRDEARSLLERSLERRHDQREARRLLSEIEGTPERSGAPSPSPGPGL
jgi:tetratricopeptide (TPR) repeat protein